MNPIKHFKDASPDWDVWCAQIETVINEIVDRVNELVPPDKSDEILEKLKELADKQNNQQTWGYPMYLAQPYYPSYYTTWTSGKSIIPGEIT